MPVAELPPSRCQSFNTPPANPQSFVQYCAGQLDIRLDFLLPRTYRVGKRRCHTAGDGQRPDLDSYGYHLISCPWGGWHTLRHDNMVRVMLQLLRAAGSKASESTTIVLT